MKSTGDRANRRRLFVLTNVDPNELAGSPAVSAFMARIADEFLDPSSRELLSASLADAVANVLELHALNEAGGFAVPRKLYEIAADLAAKLATRRR